MMSSSTHEIIMLLLMMALFVLVIWPPYYCCFGCNLELEAGYKNMPHTENVVFASDGTCGVWNSATSKYEKPKLKLLDWKAMECLKDFHDAVMTPLCGDGYYNNFKKCAMVRFFDNKLPSEVEWTADNNDLLLVFVDGCAICKNSGNNSSKQDSKKQLKVDVKLKYKWPAGSLLTNCKDEEHEAGSFHTEKADMEDVARIFPKVGYTKEATQGASFVVNGVFYQRFCNTIFGQDDVPTSFHHIKLSVEHNCGEGKPFDVALPELITAQYKSHVVEMRALWLDLDTGTAKMFDLNPDKLDYVPELAWNNWDLVGQANEEESVEDEEQDY